MTMDAGEDTILLDVSSKLAIDGSKSYVDSGETFEYIISYTVPKLQPDQGKSYSGGFIQIQLPEYVEFVTYENNGETVYDIKGDDYSRTEYNEQTHTYYIYLKEQLTIGKATELTIRLKTDNLITPDGAQLKFRGNSFNVSYLSASGTREQAIKELNEVSTTVRAIRLGDQ